MSLDPVIALHGLIPAKESDNRSWYNTVHDHVFRDAGATKNTAL